MRGMINQLLSLNSRSARYQIGVAIALITVIPLLAIVYVFSLEPGDASEILSHRPLVVGVLLLLIFSGYALISVYPANIMRLRRYLEHMVDGDMPGKVSLLKGMADIPAIERSLNLIIERLSGRVTRMEAELKRIEWLLSRTATPSFWRQADATKRKVQRCDTSSAVSVILRGVGEDMLVDMVGDLVELMGTSAAVFDRNGQCVLNLLISDWCRFLDECGRVETAGSEALTSCGGCQASWLRAAEDSMAKAQPVDIACEGGVRVYCAPIIAGGRIIGAVGFGYGDPPRDEPTLAALASRYNVQADALRRKAEAYESRPVFIVSVAKNRLLILSKLIGAVVERYEAEEVLRHSEEELRRHRTHLEELVENRAAELRVANEKLTLEVEERRKAERLKDEFVSTVSHELRTPLAIAREGVGLLRDGIAGTLTEKQVKVLLTMESNIDRLSRIINDLLDIAKIEAGRISLVKERMNLAATVRQAVALLEPLAKKKRIEILTELPAGGAEVFGDSDRIMQVLTNLIDNAIKFTERGQVRVSLASREDGVECAVADSGIGIGAADLPKLFRKFVQIGRKPGGAGHKGTGLGLTIAKNIVELHRGRIWAESEVNRGTTFRFVLPAYGESEVLLSRISDRLATAKQKTSNMTVFLLRIRFPTQQSGEDRWVRQLVVESNALVRGSDVALSRGPGEVLVMAEVDPGLIPAVCERWQRQIARDFAQLAGVSGVTAKIGYACFPAHGVTAEELLKKAEIALANDR